jgi:GDP-mannose 6-dehydrogenase
MRLSVFGLGYVGSVTAACMAGLGHHVIGVDINALKVDALNAGRSPIVETRVDELVAKAHQAGLLSATSDAEAATEAFDESRDIQQKIGIPIPLPGTE